MSKIDYQIKKKSSIDFSSNREKIVFFRKDNGLLYMTFSPSVYHHFSPSEVLLAHFCARISFFLLQRKRFKKISQFHLLSAYRNSITLYIFIMIFIPYLLIHEMLGCFLIQFLFFIRQIRISI